ncbi:MAG: 3-phosphoserine/phosphohydroxythreonine transaminase [Myxococcota bacterium]|nr:3-phosphoserine/phosphohydroxythreonine transaminase [Myxococcota bacterium]
MPQRPVNFSAGPAILPQSVLERASQSVSALEDLGLSILEISHRSPTFDAIITEARAGIRRLLDIPETHEILFLGGGARGQFAQVPLNFLSPGQTAGYVDTGVWATGAQDEAARIGDMRVLASGADSGFTVLPDLPDASGLEDLAYVHTTSNNTIYGTQWNPLPRFEGVRHVCDMSSDIFSRPVDISSFSLIYAGAQKNAGPAGVTLVILEKAWMENARSDIPAIWRYQTQAAKDSMYNTPPTFPIYVVGLVVKWLEELGGLGAMEARNKAKAGLLYDLMDRSNGFYVPTVPDPKQRSLMNVTWRLGNRDEEGRFLEESAGAGLSGLKGHRKVGGIRASIYNAMPPEGVEQLVKFMERFAAAGA